METCSFLMGAGVLHDVTERLTNAGGRLGRVLVLRKHEPDGQNGFLIIPTKQTTSPRSVTLLLRENDKDPSVSGSATLSREQRKERTQDGQSIR
jgi:hypothetical protein